MSGRTRWLSALLCAGLTAGCIGVPPHATSGALRATAPLEASDRHEGPWPAERWWEAWHDPQLSALIELARKGSPSLDMARARVAAAEANVRSAAAADGLHVNATGDLTRQRLSDNGLIPPKFLGYHWYTQSDLGLSLDYTFDWWGKIRSQVHAALDARRAASAEQAAADLALTVGVAELYFGWQSDQAHLALADANRANLEQQRTLAEQRVQADLARGDELVQLDASLVSVHEQQQALSSSSSLRRVALAALLGVDPSALPALTATALPRRDSGLPADARLALLAHRPDIVASRWRVEAAAQGVEAARAGFYPDISLRALIGLSSVTLSKLIEAGSADPQAGAVLSLPLFDAGRLRAQYAGTRAELDLAIASYNDAVITAARDAATQALAVEDWQARRLEREQRIGLAEQLHALAAAREQAGLADARATLAAAAQVLTARDALADLDGAAVQAELELTRALGGGYRPETSELSALTPPVTAHTP